jgi:hypothetical protein
LPEYPADLANDGFVSNTGSYWATDVNVAGDGTVAGEGKVAPESWWQVDLEEPTELARVVVIFYYGDERTYEFCVETSLDGQTWDLAADYRGNPQRAVPEGTSVTFPPTTARYLRVTLTKNSANTGRHLVEVLAFGEG